MFEDVISYFILLKQEFTKHYSGSAHIQEIIPTNVSDKFTVDPNHLEKLHKFAQKNPIYFNSYEDKILQTSCIVYEGDINEYWLNSIKHGSSCQPFYPTWIMSAYFMTLIAHKLGYSELIDIGSGDGRIAFCGTLHGMNSYSVEIDEMLVNLQETIVNSTAENFNPLCEDALEFDYSQTSLSNPIFFIGGLSQMGGDILAAGILEKVQSVSNLKSRTGIVLTGTNSKRQLSNNMKNGGWDHLIEKYGLNIIRTVSLPTVWTFDQKVETPYIFTKFN